MPIFSLCSGISVFYWQINSSTLSKSKKNQEKFVYLQESEFHKVNDKSQLKYFRTMRQRKYERIPSEDQSDIPSVHKSTKRSKKFENFLPEQFKLRERPIPWKAIGYAAILFVLGTVLLLCGCLIHVGHIDNQRYGDRLWPLIIFGSLLFIPGSYHVFIAIQTFRGVPGYDFEDFPSYDWDNESTSDKCDTIYVSFHNGIW